MKRFTDTDKWRDPWFQDLPPKIKLFFIFILDSCDSAGVWKPNFRLASFTIGEPIEEAEAKSCLGGRIKVLPNGNWWIVKFILFQYGRISMDCKPHMPVFNALSNHGIALEAVQQSERLSKAT